MLVNSGYDVYKKTPIERNDKLSQLYGCEVYIKREDQQITRSYEIRGITNKLLSMPKDTLRNGVITCSDGNFGISAAHCSNILGIPMTIFVPKCIKPYIVIKMREFGGTHVSIIENGDTFVECLEKTIWHTFDTNMVFIHPYEDEQVIDGYSTIGDEIKDFLPNIVVCPADGDALLISLMYASKNTYEVIGVAEFDAPECKNISESKCVQYKFIKDKIRKICVDDNEICCSVEELHNDGIVVDNKGALAICGLNHIKSVIVGKKILCITNGGNIVISEYDSIHKKSTIQKGLLNYFLVTFPQKPGSLKLFVNNVLDENDDIVRFEYLKKTNDVFGNVLIGIKMGDVCNLQKIKRNMKKFDFKYRRLKSNDDIFNFLI